jgi:O-antigen/teichoic acid export membrane protein
MAKLATPVMVGQFTLGLAICAPVILLANLQLRAVQATDARQEYHFGHYLGLRFLTVMLALTTIAGITLASGYRRETALVILALGLAKALESISDVIFGLLQQHERMDRIATSLMIKGPASLAALGAGIWLTGSLLWGTLGLVLAWALVLALYDLRSGSLILEAAASRQVSPPGGSATRKSRLAPIWEWKILRRLLWLSLPLGAVSMLISLNSNIPRYFIEHYLGEGELGLFAAMAYFMTAGTTVAAALGQSASPRLARYAITNKPAFRALLLKLLILGAVLGAAGVLLAWAAGREILTRVYRPEYAERLEVFIWLMGAAGCAYVGSFLSVGITAARYFRAQFPLHAIVTGTAVLACWWLVPSSGIKGAALAFMISNLVYLALAGLIMAYASRTRRCS